MNLHEDWQRALANTEIIRSRVQALLTFADTRVPYILLSESAVNHGDTVVRQGEILVERPSLILPPSLPQFEGFDLGEEKGVNENSLINFLLVRGINLPSLKYNNQTNSLDMFEDKLQSAVSHYRELLQKKEDVQTGLVVGPQDCWQFSLLIFICSQIMRNADTDVRKLMDEFKKRPQNE